MISLLHTADWQIGRVFAQFEPDDAAALFEARFRVIEKLAQFAHEHAVDAVLVAGDVFDAQTIADKTIRRMFNAMQGFAGPWVLLPGNHDAALSESIWQRAERLGAIPPNVLCCLEAKAHRIAGKFTLLPAPLTQRHSYEDLTQWFDAVPPDEPRLPRIGLAHGSVQGILWDDIDAANPISADRVAQAELDYLALGDWHGSRRINTRCWYAGTPETDRFRANDSGQALWVRIEAARAEPDVQVLRTGQHAWQNWEERLDVASDVEELVQRLQTIGGNDVLQLRLTGHCDLAAHQQLASAVAAARARARALIWDDSALRLQPTDADIERLQADGFVGEALQTLRAQQDEDSEDDAECARDALLALAQILAAQQDEARP